MTEEQRKAILDLCEIVQKVMCENCTYNCSKCTMVDWVNECRKPFEQEEGE